MFDESSQSFQYHIPNADIAASKPLEVTPRSLQLHPRPKSMQEGLASCNIENAIGRICLSEQAEMTVADISIGQLPAYDAIDPAIKNYRERWVAENRTRLPFLQAGYKLLQKLVYLSELQYEFGVPRGQYNTDYP